MGVNKSKASIPINSTEFRLANRIMSSFDVIDGEKVLLKIQSPIEMHKKLAIIY